MRQLQVIKKYYPFVRDWIRWSRPNWVASGSLVCYVCKRLVGRLLRFSFHTNRIHSGANVDQYLVSVATLLRPLTIINVMGIGPSVLLRQLTAYLFVWNLCATLVTDSR